jgi:hypothetical protein
MKMTESSAKRSGLERPMTSGGPRGSFSTQHGALRGQRLLGAPSWACFHIAPVPRSICQFTLTAIVPTETAQP